MSRRLLLCLLVVGVVGTLVAFGVVKRRREGVAEHISVLRKLHSSQSLFWERNARYARSFQELHSGGNYSATLADGRVEGYTIVLFVDSAKPYWIAFCDPGDKSGLSFCVDQSGTIYSGKGPLKFVSADTLPPGVTKYL